MTFLHLLRAAVLTVVTVAAVLWPCLPGAYDPLALPISMTARLVNWASLLFVPIGIAWWGRDAFLRRPASARVLGMLTVCAVALVALMLVLCSAVFGGALLAAIAAAIAMIALRSGTPRWLRAAAGIESGSAALTYLVVVPVVILTLQLPLFERAVAANRARVIGAAAPLIEQIETFRRERGHYPESLLSSTTDFRPRSKSVARFWYERAGDAYHLAFEQPPAALDMREFVVYHPGGRAVFTSHDGDLLQFQGDALERRRGFPSSADVPGHPGWRVFRFD